jgi:hypothetical protein
VNTSTVSAYRFLTTDNNAVLGLNAYSFGGGVSIGNAARANGTDAITIGVNSSNNSAYTIAIGTNIANSVATSAKCVIINADTGLEPIALQENSCYINPIRREAKTNFLYYDPTTKEITYSTIVGGGGGGGSDTFSTLFTSTMAFSTLVGASDSQLYINGITTSTLQLGASTIGLGYFAQMSNASEYAVGVGFQSGMFNQGGAAVAVGASAGSANQGTQAVAIGAGAQLNGSYANAIAIGYLAGNDPVGIGQPQAPSSIVINATGDDLTTNIANSFVVAPVRDVSGTHGLYYNTTTKEISYSTIGGLVSSFSTLNVSSMLTASTITTSTINFATDNIAIGSNVSITQGTRNTVLGTDISVNGVNQSNAIFIGRGLTNSAINSVAIGFYNTGIYGTPSIGNNTIAIGNNIGGNSLLVGQSNIILNATNNPIGTGFNNSGFYVNPVRQVDGVSTLVYNPTTFEISYDDGRVFQQLFASSIVASSITTSSIFGTFGQVSSMFISSLSTPQASISTANISSLTTSYINATGVFGQPGSISTAVLNVSTGYISTLSSLNVNSQLGNISSFTVQNINNLGGGVGGSLSTFAMSVSTANISTFSTNFMTARGASISTLTVSTLNNTFAGYGMPKWSMTSISTITPQTGTLTSYLASPLISSIPGAGFVATANITYVSGAGITANNEITALFYVNGVAMGLSTVKTNTGGAHLQQIPLTLASTFSQTGSPSSTNQVSVYIKNNNATPGNYSTLQGTITLVTNLI